MFKRHKQKFPKCFYDKSWRAFYGRDHFGKKVLYAPDGEEYTYDTDVWGSGIIYTSHGEMYKCYVDENGNDYICNSEGITYKSIWDIIWYNYDQQMELTDKRGLENNAQEKKKWWEGVSVKDIPSIICSYLRNRIGLSFLLGWLLVLSCAAFVFYPDIFKWAFTVSNSKMDRLCSKEVFELSLVGVAFLSYDGAKHKRHEYLPNLSTFSAGYWGLLVPFSDYIVKTKINPIDGFPFSSLIRIIVFSVVFLISSLIGMMFNPKNSE